MSRPKSVIPKLCHDRSRDRAFCKVDGKFVSLGKWGSPEAQTAYAELLANLAAGLSVPRGGRKSAAGKPGVTTVNELALAFMLWAGEHYKSPATGKPSAEFDCHKSSIRKLVQLYGLTDAAEFSPNKLRAVRDLMISEKWSRTFINRSVGRLKFLFKWGVGRELVSVEVWQSLTAVESLTRGRSLARETAPRKAVPEADLEAVRAVLSERDRDVLDLLLLSGSRPGELLGLTVGEIDTRGEVWRATLDQHKTSHRGKARTLYFGGVSQTILAKYLADKQPADRLFKLRRDNFNHYIAAACEKAGVNKFTPHRLRHTAATRIRDVLTIEHAQAALGHASPSMTERYSLVAEAKALEAARVLG